MSSTPTGTHLSKKTKLAPARWDDEKTKLFLELIEGEIIGSNRPAGVLSKQGWRNVVTKLNELTGSEFTKYQLKNKQDNLRWEFTKWESLIGKETRLGWDPVRRTLTAPDEWWEERAKVDPAILKYKESGPVHLELFQKVFGGVTTTDYRAYVPEMSPDPLVSEEQHLDGFDADGASETNSLQPVEGTPINCPAVLDGTQVEQTPVTSKLRAKKRKRRSGVNHPDNESKSKDIK